MGLINQIKDGSYNAIITLIKYYNFRISRLTVNNLLEKNPYHPSMRAISDTLDSLGIEHGVYSIDKNLFSQIEAPFIAQTMIAKGEFIWVKSIERETMQIVMIDGKSMKVPLDYFFEIWTGTVLLVETEELKSIREKNYIFKELQYLINKFSPIAFISILFISLIFFIIQGVTAFSGKLIFIINLIGFLTSIVIVYKTFYSSNFINKFCKVGSNIDCNAILQSRIAKPFDWLSLGEWGLIYFLASLSIGLMPIPNVEQMFYLFILSILTVIITFLCFVYQVWVRKFCSLCLLLSTCILSGFVTLSLNISIENVFSTNGIIYFLIALSLTFFGWLFLRDKIMDSLRFRYINLKAKPLYANHDIFQLSLNQSIGFSIPNELTPISFKSQSQVKNRFDIVLSPRCAICTRVFNSIIEIIRKRDDIGVNLIMHANTESAEDNELVAQIISIYIGKGSDSAMESLIGWYSGVYPSLKLWKHKFGIMHREQTYEIIKIQKDWLVQNNIVTFPLIALNKKLLPEGYELEDVFYHI